MTDGYAYARQKRKTLWLHREIMQPPEGRHIDHMNFNGFDNRRSNLRFATSQQNVAWQRKRRDNTSGYIGIIRDKRNGRWLARISIFGKSKHIGSFKNICDAVKARDEAAKAAFGEFAALNGNP